MGLAGSARTEVALAIVTSDLGVLVGRRRDGKPAVDVSRREDRARPES